MFTPRRTIAALLLATASACSAADTINGISNGNTNNTPTNTTSGSATLTLWTSDASPYSISAMVDGSVVGTLSAYRTSAPTCGAANSNGVITIKVSAGTHVVTGKEINSTGVWNAHSMTIAANDCKTFEYQP